MYDVKACYGFAGRGHCYMRGEQSGIEEITSLEEES